MTKSGMYKANIYFNDLNPEKNHEFDFCPVDEEVGNLVADLGLLGLSKLRLRGRLFAVGLGGWVLDAHLSATVVQACVVTLVPTSTRIYAPVERKFVPLTEMEAMQVSKYDEIGIEQDDTIELLVDGINLLSILSESLALELPAYPRAKGAVLKKATFSAAGVAPISDEDTKPFAGLATLKEKLEK